MGNRSATLSHVTMLMLMLMLMLMFMCGKSSAQSQGIPCIGLSNKPGFCTALRDCKVLSAIINKNRKDSLLIQRIQMASSQCNVYQSEVCCPELAVDNRFGPASGLRLPTFEDGCGLFGKGTSFTKIIGGTPAAIGTWPWIALLAYNTPQGTQFKCAGTIITKRHILTAAHCLTRDLTSARLGEHDLKSETETKHVDMKIRKVVKHSSFSRSKNAGRSDIAIIYLDDDIQFTDLIRPVCLPITPVLKSRTYEGFMPFVAGWGTTKKDKIETSSTLLHAQIRVFSNVECTNIYRGASRLRPSEAIDDAFICAGERTGSKDACSGDSGGPLVTAERVGNTFRIILIGIVSAGLECGLANSPGLFTRTSYFINWIEDRISESL